MHDGCGLCSPGRWHPEKRFGPYWKNAHTFKHKLLGLITENFPVPAKTVMALSTGHTVISPFPEKMMSQARDIWFHALEQDSDYSVAALSEVVDSQPFYLKAIGETLRLLNDPDWRVFHKSKTECFERGVSVGANI